MRIILTSWLTNYTHSPGTYVSYESSLLQISEGMAVAVEQILLRERSGCWREKLVRGMAVARKQCSEDTMDTRKHECFESMAAADKQKMLRVDHCTTRRCQWLQRVTKTCSMGKC